MIFWKEDFDLSVETFSPNHIDSTINKGKDNEWRFTAFYGEPDARFRYESWAKLRTLKSRSSSPWICAGDFIEITRQSKKLGGRTRLHNQMQPFREVLDDYGFMDMGFVGAPFTWHKHYADYTVWERLDRAVATNDWFSMFSETKIHHLDVTTSDHKALWIVPEKMECGFQKPFRFEQMWMTDSGCTNTIEAVWRKHMEESWDTKIVTKIDHCGKALTRWSRQAFGNVKREIERKRKELSKAERRAISGGDPRPMKTLQEEINLLLDKEATMWRQRSIILWLKDGDKNTRFFHSKASQRRRRNYITRLHDGNGNWCTNQQQIRDTIVDFYTNLFTSNIPDHLEEVIDVIPKVVTAEMNASLTSEFIALEVEVALKQMAPLKAPDPDGMPPLFYQNYWPLLGNDVTQFVLHFLNSGSLPAALGHSFVTLIPKVKNLESVSQFRLISLSNVLYRVFSKILAN